MTPATIRVAPRMVRVVMVSILLRNSALKSTAKSGVVLSSGMMTETSDWLRAMKFES